MRGRGRGVMIAAGLLAVLLAVPGARGEALAPTVVAVDIDGAAVDWAATRVRGPVLVSFWATWCKPCAAELPALERVVNAANADSTATRHLSWLAINEDGPRNRTKIRAAAHRAGIHARIVPDEDGALAASFRVVSFPTTLLVDEAGRIVHVQQGYRPGDEVALAERIAALLAAPADTLR